MSTTNAVVVIDDDDDFLTNMRELLGTRGYTVSTFKSARVALDHLANPDNMPTAAIVDLRMPEMDGYAFLAACEVDARLRELPVIVVSAYGDPTGIEVDFLSKPINVSRLLRSLDKIVESGRSTDGRAGVGNQRRA